MINNHTTVYTIGWMNCDDTRDDGEYGEVSLGVGHSPHSLCGVTPKSLSVMGHAVPILNLSNLLALSARISHSLNMAISLGSLTELSNRPPGRSPSDRSSVGVESDVSKPTYETDLRHVPQTDIYPSSRHQPQPQNQP